MYRYMVYVILGIRMHKFLMPGSLVITAEPCQDSCAFACCFWTAFFCTNFPSFLFLCFVKFPFLTQLINQNVWANKAPKYYKNEKEKSKHVVVGVFN